MTWQLQDHEIIFCIPIASLSSCVLPDTSWNPNTNLPSAHLKIGWLPNFAASAATSASDGRASKRETMRVLVCPIRPKARLVIIRHNFHDY